MNKEIIEKILEEKEIYENEMGDVMYNVPQIEKGMPITMWVIKQLLEETLSLHKKDILKKIDKEIKYYENVESPLQNGTIKIINAFKKFRKSISGGDRGEYDFVI